MPPRMIAVRHLCMLLLCASMTAVLSWPLAAAPAPSQQEADSLARKLSAMLLFAEGPPGETRVTRISEEELNSFLQLSLAHRIPTGVTSPEVLLLGESRLAGKAIVDLDAVSRATPSDGRFDVRRWLTGRVPVEVRGLLRVTDGRGRFELEHAEAGGIPLPKILVQELVTSYSRSDGFPNGIDLDAPFEFPARIRDIQVSAQQAVVVQR